MVIIVNNYTLKQQWWKKYLMITIIKTNYFLKLHNLLRFNIFIRQYVVINNNNNNNIVEGNCNLTVKL